MRETARITRIMDLLGEWWRKNPDQRFGQLIENLGVHHEEGCIFYFEDTAWEAALHAPQRSTPR